MLAFDSQLTTYKILDQLTARGISWLTLRQRGKSEMPRLAVLPAGEGNTALCRGGLVVAVGLGGEELKDLSSKVRQIAVKNIAATSPPAHHLRT